MKTLILLSLLNISLSLKVYNQGYDREKILIFVKRLGKLILNVSSSDLNTKAEKEKAYDQCFSIFNDTTDYEAQSFLRKFYDIAERTNNDVINGESWNNQIFKNFIISKLETKSVILGNRNIKCFDQFGEVNEVNSPENDAKIKILFANEFDGLKSPGLKHRAITSMFSVHRDTMDKTAFLRIYK